MGIASLKPIVAFLVHFGNSVSAAQADGKYDLADLVLFLGLLKELPEAAAGLQGAVPEWKALSDADRAELVAEVEKLDIKDKTVEVMAEDVVKAILFVGPLIGHWFAPKAA